MKDLKKLIQNAADKGDEVYGKIGTISDVNKDTYTCTVEFLDGSAPVLEVRYVADISSKMIFTPKDNALGLIVFLSQETAMLVWASEYESIYFEIGDSKLTLKDNFEIKIGNSTLAVKDKFSLKNASTSLKSILNDILTRLQGMKIVDPVSGSLVVYPADITGFAATQQKVNQLFE